MLNMFRTLIHPTSEACDFSIVSPHWLCVLASMYVGVSVWLVWSGIRVAGCSSLPHGYHHNQPTGTPTHIETIIHNQCGDTIEKSQVPYDGFINVRNMLSIEEVK